MRGFNTRPSPIGNAKLSRTKGLFQWRWRRFARTQCSGKRGGCGETCLFMAVRVRSTVLMSCCTSPSELASWMKAVGRKAEFGITRENGGKTLQSEQKPKRNFGCCQLEEYLGPTCSILRTIGSKHQISPKRIAVLEASSRPAD